jgi:hypothetical protein
MNTTEKNLNVENVQDSEPVPHQSMDIHLYKINDTIEIREITCADGTKHLEMICKDKTQKELAEIIELIKEYQKGFAAQAT